MLRFLAIFNILVGVLGLLVCAGLGLLAYGLGGGGSVEDILEFARLIGWMGIAGVLLCWSGIVLWRMSPVVTRQAVALIGWAVVCGVGHCVQLLLKLRGHGELWDEEVALFVFVPLAVVVVLAVQVGFLWRRTKRQREEVG